MTQCVSESLRTCGITGKYWTSGEENWQLRNKCNRQRNFLAFSNNWLVSHLKVCFLFLSFVFHRMKRPFPEFCFSQNEKAMIRNLISHFFFPSLFCCEIILFSTSWTWFSMTIAPVHKQVGFILWVEHNFPWPLLLFRSKWDSSSELNMIFNDLCSCS